MYSLGLLDIAFNLSRIRPSKADNAERFSALREPHAIQVPIDRRVTNLAQLAIVAAIIRRTPHSGPIYFCGERERYTMFPLVRLAFGLVIFDVHVVIVVTKTMLGQMFL
jgi:hypothetical protein